MPAPPTRSRGSLVEPLPSTLSDADLIQFVDAWAAHLEREDYDAAFHHTEHVAHMGWTPALMREVIKAYGDGRPTQRVTVAGGRKDVSQRKDVTRWPKPRPMGIGEIWYDLNIDGVTTDLTATFFVVRDRAGMKVVLSDIHVM